MRTIGWLSALTMFFLAIPDGSLLAASYGCDQEKCIATCQKVGGRVRFCPQYCEKEIAKNPKCNKK